VDINMVKRVTHLFPLLLEVLKLEDSFNPRYTKPKLRGKVPCIVVYRVDGVDSKNRVLERVGKGGRGFKRLVKRERLLE
jgi:hypothetical protein